ncbi:MAG: type II toxin-antitoxin system VapC family toxin [Gemmatimonadota bacterium]|jgi:predicted nucleic acid-binding protein
MIVVDTNVMVYLLTGSGPADRAASLFEKDPEWAAPPVLLSELRNVMVGLLRRAEIEPWDALDICEDAEAVLGDRVAAVPAAPLLEAAIEGPLSAYDAEFVVLARRLRVPLVSADQAILRGASDVAIPL